MTHTRSLLFYPLLLLLLITSGWQRHGVIYDVKYPLRRSFTRLYSTFKKPRKPAHGVIVISSLASFFNKLTIISFWNGDGQNCSGARPEFLEGLQGADIT